MGFAEQSPTRAAGVTQTLDQLHDQLNPETGCPSWLAPNEHLGGDPAAACQLANRPAVLRATATLHQPHAGVSFSLLSWYLDSLPRDARNIFTLGAALMAERYEKLGLSRLLPMDRAPRPGTASAATAIAD